VGRKLFASNCVKEIKYGTGGWAGGQVVAGGLPGFGFGPGND